MSSRLETLFAAIARRRNKTVLREGEMRLDGSEVMELVIVRSARLRRLGCRRVAVALDNGLDWALWDLALLHAGLVSVPLPAFFSPQQKRHVLNAAGVDCVIGRDVSALEPAGFHSDDGRIALRLPCDSPPVHPGTAKITFTSGTTGRPKGVCLDIDTQLAVADSLRVATTEARVTRHMSVLPLSVLLENIAGLYAPLLAGIEVDLAPLAELGISGSSRLDAVCLLERLRSRSPSSIILTPQMLKEVVTALESGARGPDSLRFVAVGGAHAAPALLQRAGAVGLPVFEGYGLSECASVVCLSTPSASRVGSIGTVGQPLPHCEVRVAADGELLVRGPRMLGYLGEAPPAGEWLATGDLGAIDAAGRVKLNGRKKHLFITGWGRNVSPEWVEAELTGQAPIAQAWLYGEALPQNFAVLVPRRPDVSNHEIELAVATVNRELPDYMRVHRWLRAPDFFTPANGLATDNGRLRRDVLAERYREVIASFHSPVLQGEPT